MAAETGRSAWVQTMICFGRDIPGGGIVSDGQFEEFLRDVLTAEFPAGLTAFDAYGQMQHEDGTIEKQRTEVVLLVHEDTEAAAGAVLRVIDSYRSTFGGPQVMRTAMPVNVELFQDF